MNTLETTVRNWRLAFLFWFLWLTAATHLPQEPPAGDEGTEVKGPRGEKGKRHFEKMDSDGDGSISKAEWIAQHTTMFDKIDADADGVVTHEEMRSHHQARKRGRGRGYGRGRGPKPKCTEGDE